MNDEYTKTHDSIFVNNLLVYSVTPIGKIVLEKLTVTHMINKFFVFNEI